MTRHTQIRWEVEELLGEKAEIERRIEQLLAGEVNGDGHHQPLEGLLVKAKRGRPAKALLAAAAEAEQAAAEARPPVTQADIRRELNMSKAVLERRLRTLKIAATGTVPGTSIKTYPASVIEQIRAAGYQPRLDKRKDAVVPEASSTGQLFTRIEAAEQVGISKSAFGIYMRKLKLKPVKRTIKASDGRNHTIHYYSEAQIEKVRKSMPLSAIRLAEAYRKMTPAQRKARNEKLLRGRMAFYKARRKAATNG